MGRTTKSAFATLVLAATLAGAVAPAHAGQISINLSPANGQQQRLMQTGFGIYALVNSIENGSITQRGRNNSAGITQGGRNNLGIVYQEGNRHNGTIEQRNDGNSYGLFQFGKNTDAQVVQQGHQSGLGFVFGW